MSSIEKAIKTAKKFSGGRFIKSVKSPIDEFGNSKKKSKRSAKRNPKTSKKSSPKPGMKSSPKNKLSPRRKSSKSSPKPEIIPGEMKKRVDQGNTASAAEIISLLAATMPNSGVKTAIRL